MAFETAGKWVPAYAGTYGAATSAVDVEPEREAAGVAQLRLLLQRMKARPLDVAEGAFETDPAIEGGAARDLHRALDRADRTLASQGACSDGAVCRLGSGHRGLGVMDQLTDRHLRAGKRVLHLADEIGQVAVIRFLARDLQRLGAGALGDPEIGRVDQREGDHADDVEQHVPFALLAATGDRGLGDEDVLQLDIMRARAAHAEHVPGVEERDALAL